MAPEPVAHGDLLSTRYRRRFVAVMFVVALFHFADRAVFAVTAQQVKQELALTDLQIGILQGIGFALLYALLGLPIGRLAEHFSRIKLIAAALATWSAMTAFCGLATGFPMLLIGRLGVGMGEAGTSSVTASLVSDHFERHKRASIGAICGMGTPVGLFLGSVIAGAVAAHWGWRAAFFVMGLPGIACAGLILLLLREPPRGLADGLPPERKPPPNFTAFLRVVRTKRALLFVLMGGALAGFGMTAISQFLAVYLARVLHMPIRQAASFYGIISAISLGVGMLVGSFGTDFLARRGDGRWPAWGAAIGLFAAPFLYWIAFNAQGKAAAAVLLCVAGSTLLLFFGPTTAMIQNMLEPRMRATGAALFSMLYTLIGSGLGPTFVGFLSDRYASGAFVPGGYLTHCSGRPAPLVGSALATACADASAFGIKAALMSAVGVFFVSGACYLLASRTLRQDMYAPDVVRG